MLRKLSLALTAALLAACASTPQARWQARPGQDLAADLAACTQEAQGVNILSEGAYTAGSAGLASAMAGRLNEKDIRGAQGKKAAAAVRDACMVRKGWTPAP